MYEALLKSTPEYQKIAASLASPGPAALFGLPPAGRALLYLSLIHISEPTRRTPISYAVFCLKKKKTKKIKTN